MIASGEDMRTALQELRNAGLARWYLIIVPLLWLMIFVSLGWLDEEKIVADGWAIFLWLFQGVLMIGILMMASLFTRRMFREDGLERTPNPAIYHLVILPCYREPIRVMSQSIDTIANQSTSAKENVILVVSLEERTPDAQEMIKELNDLYRSRFLRFEVTVHPYGLEGEIAGKCSNGRWAAIHGKKLLEKELPHVPLQDVVLTSMDADTKLHHSLFTNLGSSYSRLSQEERHASIWQAGQFFNWGLAKSGFLTRITAIYRTVWMLGFNIPLKVHSMSVFSSSLLLCIRNNYFNPRYPMDDLHYYVSCMATTKGRLKLRPLYLPVISGPTSGHNRAEEVYEWGRQARRWSIGAFEIFHCAIANMKELGALRCLRHAGTIFLMYGFFQAAMAIVAFLAFPFWAHGIIRSNYPEVWLAFTAMPFLFTAGGLVIDGVFVRKLGLRDERVGLLHNLKDLLLSPLVLILYNVVAFVALHELIFGGRAVCTHVASEKEHLGAG